jgi:hypothetical protein
LLRIERAVGMEPLWSLQVQKAPRKGRERPPLPLGGGRLVPKAESTPGGTSSPTASRRTSRSSTSSSICGSTCLTDFRWQVLAQARSHTPLGRAREASAPSPPSPVAPQPAVARTAPDGSAHASGRARERRRTQGPRAAPRPGATRTTVSPYASTSPSASAGRGWRSTHSSGRVASPRTLPPPRLACGPRDGTSVRSRSPRRNRSRPRSAAHRSESTEGLAGRLRLPALEDVGAAPCRADRRSRGRRIDVRSFGRRRWKPAQKAAATSRSRRRRRAGICGNAPTRPACQA